MPDLNEEEETIENALDNLSVQHELEGVKKVKKVHKKEPEANEELIENIVEKHPSKKDEDDEWSDIDEDDDEGEEKVKCVRCGKMHYPAYRVGLGSDAVRVCKSCAAFHRDHNDADLHHESYYHEVRERKKEARSNYVLAGVGLSILAGLLYLLYEMSPKGPYTGLITSKFEKLVSGTTNFRFVMDSKVEVNVSDLDYNNYNVGDSYKYTQDQIIPQG